MWIDSAELAKRVKLMVLRHRISEDMSVFGQIYFCETDAKLYDNDEES